MKYQIAINRHPSGKIPQDDPRWGTFNDNFENKMLDQMGIINAIYEGRAYTTWHDGRRKKANFIAGQHIVNRREIHPAHHQLLHSPRTAQSRFAQATDLLCQPCPLAPLQPIQVQIKILLIAADLYARH